MNEFGRKTRKAPADESELLGPPGEPPRGRQLRETFQGRLLWVSVLVLAGSAAFAVFAVVSAV